MADLGIWLIPIVGIMVWGASRMLVRAVFVLVGLMFLAMSAFGKSIDFRHGRSGPIMPNWIGRIIFAVGGTGMLVAAYFATKASQ
jgi:hypothetical protein